MPDYKNITNNSYLHHLLRRYNPANWTPLHDGETYLIPAGSGKDVMYVSLGASYFYSALFTELQSLTTKRFLFDSDQAVEFSQLGINPAQNDGSETISPFPRFYMEFTDPLTGVVEQEPGYKDATIALTFRENAMVLTNDQLLVDITDPNITLSSTTFFLQSFFSGDNVGQVTANPVVSIEHSHKPDGSLFNHPTGEMNDLKNTTYFTDRSFKIHLPTGQAWVTPLVTTNTVLDGNWKDKMGDRSEEISDKWMQEGKNNNFDTDFWSNRDAISRSNAASRDSDAHVGTTTGTHSELPTEWLELDNLTKYYPAGAVIKGMEDRHIGYWEQVTQQYCDMFIWILMYIQSKQIIISEMMPQRSERRRLQKKGEVPQPWHILQINPKLYVNLNQTEGGDTGTTHGHRYDVRAHWRRQTIKYGPGRTLTKRVTQYVPSHMRGLQNEVYVPKTRKVEK